MRRRRRRLPDTTIRARDGSRRRWPRAALPCTWSARHGRRDRLARPCWACTACTRCRLRRMRAALARRRPGTRSSLALPPPPAAPTARRARRPESPSTPSDQSCTSCTETARSRRTRSTLQTGRCRPCRRSCTTWTRPWATRAAWPLTPGRGCCTLPPGGRCACTTPRRTASLRRCPTLPPARPGSCASYWPRRAQATPPQRYTQCRPIRPIPCASSASPGTPAGA